MCLGLWEGCKEELEKAAKLLPQESWLQSTRAEIKMLEELDELHPEFGETDDDDEPIKDIVDMGQSDHLMALMVFGHTAVLRLP